MTKVIFAIVPPDDLSTLAPPPVPAGLDLRHFDCMHLNVVDLLESALWDECSGDEIAMALRLWAHAWRQVPCSSLPNDDRRLRRLAGCEGRPQRWRRCRIGALRGFKLGSDGRLYHGKIAKTATIAANKSRAGRSGAGTRWKGGKSLKRQNTGDATAYGKHDGRGDGNVDGRNDGRNDAVSMQRREDSISSPLPPSSPARSPSVGPLEGPSSGAGTPTPPERETHFPPPVSRDVLASSPRPKRSAAAREAEVVPLAAKGGER